MNKRRLTLSLIIDVIITGLTVAGFLGSIILAINMSLGWALATFGFSLIGLLWLSFGWTDIFISCNNNHKNI